MLSSWLTFIYVFSWSTFFIAYSYRNMYFSTSVKMCLGLRTLLQLNFYVESSQLGCETFSFLSLLPKSWPLCLLSTCLVVAMRPQPTSISWPRHPRSAAFDGLDSPRKEHSWYVGCPLWMIAAEMLKAIPMLDRSHFWTRAWRISRRRGQPDRRPQWWQSFEMLVFFFISRLAPLLLSSIAHR